MPSTEIFNNYIHSHVLLSIFSLKYAAIKHAKQVSQGRIIVISLHSIPSKFKGDYINTYPGQNREMVDSSKGSVRQLRKRKQEYCYIHTQLPTNLSNHKQELFVLKYTF